MSKKQEEITEATDEQVVQCSRFKVETWAPELSDDGLALSYVRLAFTFQTNDLKVVYPIMTRAEAARICDYIMDAAMDVFPE